MPCCQPSRRELLRWSAAVVAAPMLGGATARAAAPAADGSIAAVGLELVTLTEDSAVLTWFTGRPATNDGIGQMEPVATDGHVDFGTRPDRLDRHAHGGSSSPYHYVEITGLEPGRTYYYQARSRGTAATPTAFTLVPGNAAGTSTTQTAPPGGPYAFTTPQPPPGRHLFSIALCNDLHLGETVAGLVGGVPSITGISQAPGHRPYPEVMARALVTEAKARGARYLLAAGDISAEAVPTDLAEAKALLDGFGTYRRDYFVARGNHDRAHIGAEWAACRPGQWQGNDCFGNAFHPAGEPSYFSTDLHGLHVVGLDTYDKAGNGGDAGGLSAEQLSWVQADLRAHAEQPTLVFGHHPLLVENSAFPISAGQSLQADQAATLLRGYAATPGVFLHHAGHTHRNARTTSPLAPGVTLQEVGAGKEYPGGFALVRFHTGGYALNFYKTRSPEARAWSERSRQEINGLWPQFALGQHVSDRNHMVRRDLSGLRPAGW